MSTPEQHARWRREHPESCRPRAKLVPPCKDCGEPTLVWPDGTSACSHGEHALERQTGVRHDPPQQGEG